MSKAEEALEEYYQSVTQMATACFCAQIVVARWIWTTSAGRDQSEYERWLDQFSDSGWRDRSKCQRSLVRIRRISALARLFRKSR